MQLDRPQSTALNEVSISDISLTDLLRGGVVAAFEQVML